MNTESHALLKNFFRRWSTIDITPENTMVFEEHVSSVRALLSEKDAISLQHVHAKLSREEFAALYIQLQNKHV